MPAPQVGPSARMPWEGRNPSLHGLRGAAVLLVLVMHLLQMGAKVGLVSLPPAPAVASALARVGPLGVVLFFMISGYLIVDSLIRHGDVVLFLRSRALRLYPVFVPLHLVMFTLGPLIGYDWMRGLFSRPAAYLGDFVANLVFLPGLFDLPLAQKNAWSLSYELAWYLAAALLFTGMLGRLRGSGAGWAVAVAAVAGLLAITVLRVLFGWFLIGAAVQLLLRHAGGSDGAPARWTRWRGWGSVTAVSAVVMAGAFLVDPLWALLPSLPLFLGIVLCAGLPARLLGVRPLQWLGTISYSFYLVHPFVLESVRRLAAATLALVPAPVPFAGFVVVGVGAALGAGWLVNRYLEVRFSRWLEARLPRPGRRAAAGGRRAETGPTVQPGAGAGRV